MRKRLNCAVCTIAFSAEFIVQYPRVLLGAFFIDTNTIVSKRSYAHEVEFHEVRLCIWKCAPFSEQPAFRPFPWDLGIGPHLGLHQGH